MIAILAAVLTVAVTSLPGWLAGARARLPLGPTLAAGFASTIAVLIATALVSEAMGYLPAWSTIIVGLVASAVVLLNGRDRPILLPSCSPVLLLVPFLMVLHAYATYRVGFGIDQNPAVFRAWYNADWFKHLGHTHALTNLGLPARDIFGGGERLHYYWLFYLLPAAGSSFHGNVEAALAASNMTLIFLFWLLVSGLLKQLGLSDRKAALVTWMGWAIFTVHGTLSLLFHHDELWWHIHTNLLASGILTALNSFIPQHVLAIAGLLSFGLLWTSPAASNLRWLALAPIVGAGATSTMVGASILTIAGLTILVLGPGGMVARLGMGAAVLALTIALTLALQVLDLSFGSDALASPALEGAANERSAFEGLVDAVRAQLLGLGLALPLGIWGLVHGFRHREAERPLLIFSAIMLVVGMGVMIGTDAFLDNLRLTKELRYRNSYLVCLALLAGIGLLLQNMRELGRLKWIAGGMIALTVALAIPSNILNFIWQGRSGPSWQVVVPQADLRALRWLRANSEAEDVVLQFPEPIYEMDRGRDTWVPIFAGRMIPGSYRSTSWSEGRDWVELARRFYTGEPVRLPPDVDWIYLSRALHPQSYDLLLRKVAGDVGWQLKYCGESVCLFSRRVR